MESTSSTQVFELQSLLRDGEDTVYNTDMYRPEWNYTNLAKATYRLIKSSNPHVDWNNLRDVVMILVEVKTDAGSLKRECHDTLYRTIIIIDNSGQLTIPNEFKFNDDFLDGKQKVTPIPNGWDITKVW